MTTVLIVDDEESICWGLSKLCEQLSYQSHTASSAERGLELAKTIEFDLVLMDVRLPGMDGITAIESFRKLLGPIPIITITAFGDLQTAIDAIQKGAFEYIVKPFDLEVIQSKIKQAIATQNLANTMAARKTTTSSTSTAQRNLVGSSPLMQEVFKQIALTTTSESPILITGESGTGKELAARSIHQHSQRASQPFVAVNIAALSPSLAESELFGHVKGAFTGANSDRVGLIQQANKGTLFLDEIAEIPLGIQVKLLRVLDLGEVTPVGSNEAIKTDFRLISATHQDLLSQINHGEFRHDLFYRLRTFEIKLPPLRNRKEDIPDLVAHFLSRYESISKNSTGLNASDEFIEKLKSRPWHGNIRELQSVVERAATIARGGLLTAEHVADKDDALPSSNAGSIVDQIQSLVQQWTRQNWHEDTESPLYEQIIRLIDPAILPTAFELSERQYSSAARRLGIHRTTLKKKIDEINANLINVSEQES